MRPFRSLLALAPLLALCCAGAAFAGDEAPPVNQNIPPAQYCYLKCMKPNQDCQDKCHGKSQCTMKCAKELGQCAKACGGPPPPPPTQNP